MFFLRAYKTLATLGAALLLSGCAGVLEQQAQSVLDLGRQLAGGAQLGSTQAYTQGNGPPRRANFFTSEPGQDSGNAGSGTRNSAILGLSPNYTSENQLTSSGQGEVVQGTGTANVPTTGSGTQEVPIRTYQDQGLTTSLNFIIGDTGRSGGTTQARFGLQSPSGIQASRVVVAAAQPLVGGLIDGASYEYTGALAWTLQHDFTNIAVGEITVTLNLSGGSSTFTLDGQSVDNGSTSGLNETAHLDFTQSDFVFNTSTGSFSVDTADVGAASATNGFRVANSSGVLGAPVAFTLSGHFAGIRGQSITGLFATTGDNATGEYVGGFVASGSRFVETGIGSRTQLAATYTRAGDGALFRADLNFPDGASASEVYFVTGNYSQLYAHFSSPVSDVKTAGLLDSIGDATFSGTGSAIGTTGLRRVDATATYRGASVPIASYADPSGDARLLRVNASNNPNVGSFLVAGGDAIQTPGKRHPDRRHTYRGVQLVALRGNIQNATPQPIQVVVNFGTPSFTYSTLNTAQGVNVAGTATISSVATGIFSATAASTSFTVTPQGGTAINAELRGRAGGLWSAFSGVFFASGGTSASPILYEGGFVAHLPDVAALITTGGAGSNTLDIGTADNINLGAGADGVVDDALFVAADTATLVTRANTLPIRGTDLLSGITPDLSGLTLESLGAAAGNARRGAGSFTNSGQSFNFYIYYGDSVTARLLVLGGAAAGNAPVVSAIFAGGSDFSGTLSGSYAYTGAYLYDAKSSLHAADANIGKFELTASFSGGNVSAFSFTGAKADGTGSLAFTAAGTTASVSGSRFSATGGFFRAGTGTPGSGDQPAVLYGIFSGADGLAISGVFATTPYGAGNSVAGGFVGGGKSDVATLIEPTAARASGLGNLADRNLGPGSVNGIAVAGDAYAALIAGTASANDATRNRAFLAGLRPSGFGAPTAVGFAGGITTHLESRANTRTGGGYNSGGNYPATQWTNFGGQAQLVLFDGSGISGSGARGSFFAAGGAARPTTGVLSGGFTWTGALVLGDASDLDGTPEIGRFTLRYNFGSSDAVKGNLVGAFADVPGNGGTTTAATLNVGVAIDAASGRITHDSDGSFSLAAGSAYDGELSGYVSGASAQGVSGVFATFGTTQTTHYAGGFVGGAPLLAQSLANPANGLRIGTAREDVSGTSGGARGALFLSSSAATFNTHANALNVVSDTARGNALLANLRDGLSGGVLVPDTGINRYTLSSSNKITYGTSEIASGVVFGDPGLSVRLVAADGFLAVGGTLLTTAASGTYEYSGAFVSAASGSLGSALREGTFDLVATLNGAASTHYFTLDAQTTNTGGTVTSQLNVTQANGGTINATTGAFSATAASFIEGAGSTGGIPALVHGRLLNGGAGVAGLFTTTQAGTIYAGGFAGAVLDLVDADFATTPTYAGQSGAGFTASNRIQIPGGTGGQSYLFATNLEKLVEDANSTTPTTRDRAYLAQISNATPSGTRTALSEGFSRSAATGARYDPDGPGVGNPWIDISVTVYTDRFGIARAAHSPTTGQTRGNYGSLLIAGGDALTSYGGALSGEYAWAGTLIYGDAGALGSVSETTNLITVTNLGASGSTGWLSINFPTGVTVGLAGSLSVDVATGRLSNLVSSGTSVLTFQTATGANTTAQAVFAGLLHGPGGISLSGVFATTGKQIGGKNYAGALIATSVLDTLEREAGGAFDAATVTGLPIIASGAYGVAGQPAAQTAHVLAPVGSSALFDANHASANIRGNALVAALGTVSGENTALDVGKRVAADGTYVVFSRAGQISRGGASVSATVYQDYSGEASLVVVGGAANADRLIAAGAAAGPATKVLGTYTWEGVHLQGDAGNLASLAQSRFTLTTTLVSGATSDAFTYEAGSTAGAAALSVTGSFTRATGVFDLSGTSTFSLTPASGSAITTGAFYGRAGGAASPGFDAVSGVFTTTNTDGTVYAGGFLGGGPQIAAATQRFGTGDAHGFGEASVTIDGAAAGSETRLVFVAENVNKLILDTNLANKERREGGVLDALTTSVGSPTTGDTRGIDFETGRAYTTHALPVSIDIYEAGSGDARLFATSAAASVRGIDLPFIYAAKARTGDLVNGGYIWQGIHRIGTATGEFQITANLTGGTSDSFTYTTLDRTGDASAIGGTGVLNTTAGTLSNSTGGSAIRLTTYASGVAQTPQDLLLRGELGGASGAAIVGLFATDIHATTLGGFVGTGLQEIETILPGTFVGDTTQYVGLGYADNRNLGAADGAVNGIVFVSDEYEDLLAVTGSASNATRAGSIIATINPTGFDAATQVSIGNAPEAAAQTSANGANPSGTTGQDYVVTRWQDSGGNASLLRLDGTAATTTGTGSFYVAGGATRTPSTELTGGAFTWAGVLLLGTQNYTATPVTAGFQLTADFGDSGNGVFTSTVVNLGATTAFSVNTVIDASTGRISNRSGAGILRNGVNAGGAISGFVVGANAQAVTGVFASSTSFAIGGGFVGGAPQVGRNLHERTGTAGYSIGQAHRSVFSGTNDGAGRILFLGDEYTSRRDALNVVSDTLRNQQILSNLDVATTGAGTAIGTVTKHSSVAVTYGVSNGSSTTATIWQDSGATARLLAFDDLFVAGGKALSGTLAGIFEYEGVLVTAESSDFGTTREGTFTLAANFGTDTFTFTGTTNATPDDNTTTQSSRLFVGTGATGSVDSDTGVLLATAASYTEGTGDDKTADVRFSGQILGVGGTGVAGLFTSALAGTNYLGGFVGSVRELVQVRTTVPAYTAVTGAAILSSNRIQIPGGKGGSTFLFAHNTAGDDGVVAAANSATVATRDGAFLAQIGNPGTTYNIAAPTVVGDGFLYSATATGANYDSDGTGTTASPIAIPISVTTDRFGIARYAHVQSTGQTSGAYGALVIAGGDELSTSGAALTGAYQWTGSLVYSDAAASAFNTVSGRVATSITATGTGALSELSFAVPSGTGPGIFGTVGFDAATGILSNNLGQANASTLNFRLTDGGLDAGTVFAGRLHGPGGISLSGVFATTGTQIGGKHYAGAVIATGASNKLVRLAGGAFDARQITKAPIIARGAYGLAGIAATQEVYVVAPVGSSALFDANHASTVIRGKALVAGLGTITGDNTSLNAAQRLTGEGVHTLNTRSAAVTIDGAAHTVTLYQDAQEIAALALVGPSAGGVPLTLLAGGSNAAPATGTYNWSGVHLQGNATTNAVADFISGRFSLDITFTAAATASFAYEGGLSGNLSSLSASGTATRASGTFVSASTATGFIYRIDANAANNITDGKLYGRFAGQNLEAVSGVFATSLTTAGAVNYFGGFVGGGPQVAHITGEAGAGGSAFGTTRASIDGAAAAAKSTLVFVVPEDISNIINEANSSSAATRANSIFESLDSTGTFAPSNTGSDFGIAYKTGGSFSHDNGTRTISAFDSGSGRFFFVNSNHTSLPDFYAYTVTARSGDTLDGAYTWEGLHHVGGSNQGRFRITATLAGNTDAPFTYTTLTNLSGANIAGSGTINANTGVIAASIPAGGSPALTLSSGTAGSITTNNLTLRGEIAGAAGAGVVGVFLSDASSPAYGAFTGTGPQPVETVLAKSGSHVGIGYVSNQSLGAGTADGIALVVDEYDVLLAATGSAHNATRAGAITTRIDPSAFTTGTLGASVPIGSDPEARATTSVGGTNATSVDGQNYTVIRWRDDSEEAILLRLDGSTLTTPISFYVAGAKTRTQSSALTGAFTWAGAVVFGTARIASTGPNVGSFQLTADFGLSGANAGNGTFEATLSGRPLVAQTVIDSTTGRISNRPGTQLSWEGDNRGGALSGFVAGSSAGAVSGVFANELGPAIVGGFVGGAPQVGRDLYVRTGATGFSIGQAKRSLFHTTPDHGDGSVLFLGSAYATRRDGLNTVSDTARNQQILSNLDLDVSAAGAGTKIADTTRYDNVAFTYGANSGENGTAKVWDSGSTARLVALSDLFVAGGQALSGTLTGAFDYVGVFVSADAAAFGVTREGAFTLNVNFTDLEFTFTGTTTGSGGSQTSKLLVGSGGAAVGAVDTTTGLLSTDTASYIEGTGDTKTSDAIFRGRALGAGGVSVAGLFTTVEATGDNYFGGFAGTAIDLVAAHATTPAYSGADDDGFIKSDRLRIPGGQVGDTFLFAHNAANLISDANDGARVNSFLARVGRNDAINLGGATALANGFSNRSATGARYDNDLTDATGAKSISVNVVSDSYGFARYAHASAAGHTAGVYGSFVIAGGAPFQASALVGSYQWSGSLSYGEVNGTAELNAVTRTAITATATSLSGADPQIRFGFPSGTTSGLVGTLTLNKTTGALVNSTLELQIGGGNKAPAVFAGRLAGPDGISFSGVFATSGGQINDKDYGGAIALSGVQVVARLSGGTLDGTRVAGAPIIAGGEFPLTLFGSREEGYVLAPVGSEALYWANHASTDLRQRGVSSRFANQPGGATASFEVPDRLASDGDLIVSRQLYQLTSGALQYEILIYQDRSKNASLLVTRHYQGLESNAHRRVPIALVSGGAATTDAQANAATGAYTWTGVHFQGNAAHTVNGNGQALTGGLWNLDVGRFTLDVTFTAAATATFTYEGGREGNASSLSATGTVTKTSGTLVSASTATGFIYRIDANAANNITDGKLYGRLSGANFEAVSGVFATSLTASNATNYAGGFVGGGPQVASVTALSGPAGTGFGAQSASIDGSTDTQSDLVFATPNISQIIDDANKSSAIARAASLLESIDSTGTFTGTDTESGIEYKTGGSFSYGSDSVGLSVFNSGSGRLFYLNTDASSGVPSPYVYVAGASSGTIANGGYSWQGLHHVGGSDQGRFQIVANLTGGDSDTFTYSTLSNASTVNIAGTGSVNSSTGVLGATSITLTSGSSGTPSDLAIRGEITGTAGAGVLGVFIAADGKYGGFVGTGKQDVVTVLPESGNFGLGYVASRNIGTGTANGIAFIGDRYSELLATTAGAADATRADSIIATIAPTGLDVTSASDITGATLGDPEARARTITGGENPSVISGDTYAVTRWLNFGNNASLLRLNGSSFASDSTKQGSFYVAGGDVRPDGDEVAGGFVWAGALVVGTRDLDATAEPAITAFQLTADFATSGNGTLTGTIAQGTFSVDTVIDQNTGRISNRSGAQIVIAGVNSGGALSGYVSGGALEGVSGVFATSAIAGGFVGGAPQIGRNLYAGTADSHAIDQANRAVFAGGAHSAGRILFLGANRTDLSSAINVTSDFTRDAQLLSALGAAPSGGTTSGNIVKHTGVTISSATATIWQNSANTARLFAFPDLLVAGGVAFSGGPLTSGVYTYEGAFASASYDTADTSPPAFGTLREGTFTLAANFDASTFTFSGTTNSTPSDPATPQSSGLEVTTGGTVSGTTGILLATDAAYTEGASTASSVAARLHGRILGAGGSGVAGLFTTTAGTRYVGGFAGALRQLVSAYDTTPTYAGAANAGFLTSSRIQIPGGQAGPTFLFANNAEALRLAANNSTAATRDGAFLARINNPATPYIIATPTAVGDGFRSSATVTGATYDSDGGGSSASPIAIPIQLTTDRFGFARYAHVSNSGQTSGAHGSLVIAGGTPLGGGTLSGEYEWTGSLVYGNAANLSTVSRVNTSISTDDIAASSPTLTFVRPGSENYGLTGSVVLDKATGILSNGDSSGSSTLTFRTTQSGASAAAVFAGRLHGADAISLSGVFATTGTAIATVHYAGAVIATGASDKLAHLAGGAFTAATIAGSPAIARGDYAVAGHPASETAYVVAPVGSGALYDANHASANIRATAHVAQLGTIGGTNESLNVGKRIAADGTHTAFSRTSTVTFGAATPDVTVYQDNTLSASLVVVDGAAKLLATSGAAATVGAATGGYTWNGVHLQGDASNLAGLTPGRFALTVTFGANATAAFRYDGGLSGNASSLTATGNVTKATGVFESGDAATDFTYRVDTTASNNITDGKLYGRLAGDDLEAVSGVFATSTSGTNYAGGFVGSAPQVLEITETIDGSTTTGFGLINATLRRGVERLKAGVRVDQSRPVPQPGERRKRHVARGFVF